MANSNKPTNSLLQDRLNELKLFDAIDQNDIVKFQSLLEQGANANVIGESGRAITPLILALGSGVSSEFVRLLLKHNANPNYIDKNGLVAMFGLSSGIGSQQKVDPNIFDNNGMTVLHYAMRLPLEKAAEMVQFLLDNGVNLHVKHPKTGLTVLEIALSLPNGKYFEEMLLEHATKNRPSELEEVEVSMADSAYIKSTVDSTKMPIVSVIPTTKKVQEPMYDINFLTTAIKSKDLEFAKKIIVQINNVNEADQNGDKALVLAMNTGYEYAKLLLECGADPNTFDRRDNPIFCNANLELTKLLIEYNVNLHGIGGMSAVMHFTNKDTPIEKLKLLIENHADIEVKSLNGYSSLWWAINNGNEEAIEYLVMQGANTSITRRHDGLSILECSINYFNRIKMLVANDVNVNQINNEGETVLIRLSAQKKLEVTEYLLQHHANPNIVAKGGYTPLMKAAYICNYEMVNLLIKYNAKAGTTDDWNDTALMRARHTHMLTKYETLQKRTDCEKTIRLLDEALYKESKDSDMRIDSNVKAETELPITEVTGQGSSDCWYGFNWLCELVA